METVKRPINRTVFFIFLISIAVKINWNTYLGI
jgi:hypothetical protein